LKSIPGCLAQVAHTDFTADDLEGITGQLLLGCIIALMDNTPFNVWQGAFNCFTELAKEARFCCETIMLWCQSLLHKQLFRRN
jgi:hypothetical protein